MSDFIPELRRKSEQTQAATLDDQNSALVQYLISSGTAKVIKHGS